jgi:hypothetical protein
LWLGIRVPDSFYSSEQLFDATATRLSPPKSWQENPDRRRQRRDIHRTSGPATVVLPVPGTPDTSTTRRAADGTEGQRTRSGSSNASQTARHTVTTATPSDSA